MTSISLKFTSLETKVLQSFNFFLALLEVVNIVVRQLEFSDLEVKNLLGPL